MDSDIMVFSNHSGTTDSEAYDSETVVSIRNQGMGSKTINKQSLHSQSSRNGV